MPKKTCAVCGTLFAKKPRVGAAQWESRRFCSRRCAANRRRPDSKRLTKTCEWCAVVFTKIVSLGLIQWRRQRYCSWKCSAAAHTRLPLIKRCDICDCEFRPRRVASTFCSNKCSGKARRSALTPSIKTCRHCGCEFGPPDGRRRAWERRIFCSPRCKYATKMSDAERAARDRASHLQWLSRNSESNALANRKRARVRRRRNPEHERELQRRWRARHQSARHQSARNIATAAWRRNNPEALRKSARKRKTEISPAQMALARTKIAALLKTKGKSQ